MGDRSAVLNKNEATEGFDMLFGKSWVYPTNKPVREYQYNITKEALFKNTMVCLPTGLGKTFIAAVIMYNFFRWYPHGKIIFMAPTRPLVKQQVDACYDIVAIPKDATAELTGTSSASTRGNLWDEKRVFFITPQVLQNDLDKIAQLGNQIKCLVFDEAHRARGNHAYCEVMRKVVPINKNFRVLALSATPGSTVTDVVKVCKDLLIAHLEMRTEESADVVPYVFKRTIDTVVVPLGGKLSDVKEEYMKVLDKYVRVLVQHRVVLDNCSMLTKGKLFYIMKEYKEKPHSDRGAAYNEIMKNLNICLILYHAYEVLIKHGLRGFLVFFEENADKPLIKNNSEIFGLMDDVRTHLGSIPSVDMLPNGDIPEIPKNTVFGHPKFYKLSDIVVEHYKSKGESSKVIIFCEYKESVMEAYTILLMQRPLVKPKIFVGQGSITQKQQINVMKAFRSGTCNTLISTSIGEEGLDVGEVDLVICFDISNKSSIRMIQRIGRTGRKREGHVIMLVTEGKEHQLLQESLRHKNQTANSIMTSRELTRELYKNNPRMVPPEINPECKRMFITIEKPKAKLKNNDLKSMFSSMGSSKDDLSCVVEFIDRIPKSKLCCFEEMQDIESETKGKCNFAKNFDKQRVLHSVMGEVGSSADSKMFVSLLQFAESKRYNIPISQSSCGSSDSGKSKKDFKQSDIRKMFFKKSTTNIKSSQEPPPLIKSIDEKYNKEIYNELQNEMADYLTYESILNKQCQICTNLFTCEVNVIKNDNFNPFAWIQPDIAVLESINLANLTKFLDKINPKCEVIDDEFNDIMGNFDMHEQESPILSKTNESPILHRSIHTPSSSKTDIPILSNTMDSVMFDTPQPNKNLNKTLLPKKTNKLDEEVIDVIDVDADSWSQKKGSFFELPASAKKILQNHPVSQHSTYEKDVSKKSNQNQSNAAFEFPSGAKHNLQKQPSSSQLFGKHKAANNSDSSKNLVSKKPSSAEITARLNATLDFFQVDSLNDLLGSDEANMSEDDTTKLEKEVIGLFDNDCPSPPSPTQRKNAAFELPAGAIDILRKHAISPQPLDENKATDNSNLVGKKPGSDEIAARLNATLNFFQVDSLDDFLGAEEMNSSQDLDATIICQLSPVMNIANGDFESPLLSQRTDIVSDLKNKANKRLFSQTSGTNSATPCQNPQKISKPNFASLRKARKGFYETPTAKVKTGLSPKKDLGVNDIFETTFLEELVKPPVEDNSPDLFESSSSIHSGKSEDLFECETQTIEINSQIDDVVDLNKDTEEKLDGSQHRASEQSKRIKKKLFPSESPLKKSSSQLESPRHKTSSQSENKSVSQLNYAKLPIRKKEKKILSQESPVKKSLNDLNKKFNLEDMFDSSVLDGILDTTDSPQRKTCQSKAPIHTQFKKNLIQEKSPCKKSWTQLDKTRPKVSSPDKGGNKPNYKKLDITHTPQHKTSQTKNPTQQQVKKKLPEKSPYKKSRSQLESPRPKVSSPIKSTSQPNYPKLVDKKTEVKHNNISLEDFCDSSILGSLQEKTVKINQHIADLNLDDFCDNSILNFLQTTRKTPKKQNTKSDIDELLNKYAPSPQLNKTQLLNSYKTKSDSSKLASPLTARNVKKTRTNSQSSTSRKVSSQKSNKTRAKSHSKLAINSSVMIVDSEDDFEESPAKCRKRVNLGNKNKKRPVNHFLEMEAEQSSDASVSEDERSGSSQDLMDASFVNDATQDLRDASVMRAHYLQSVRSPVSKGKFKIPKLPTTIEPEIFSQVVNDADDDSYLNDSFCVDEETIDLTQQDMSELEIAEMLLEEKRNEKKKKGTKNCAKRKRIRVLSDDSD